MQESKGPKQGQTWCEFLSQQIPPGGSCVGCPYLISVIGLEAWCNIFKMYTPTGDKLSWCLTNKWLETH